ncbi:MAG TPA: hypothetical protein VLF65_05230 [Burkholderiales bacterium]|nr:hypothetical protein [Burkholderiales bacterium]
MAAAADARGREAGTPREIPSRGWLDLIGAEINAETGAADRQGWRVLVR